MLQLAKERTRANDALATRASYAGWHFARVAKSAASLSLEILGGQ
jgi:hypothetical protein